MKMISLYLTEEQLISLKSFKDISIAEHIRRAIDQYIEKKKVTASVSPSKKKHE